MSVSHFLTGYTLFSLIGGLLTLIAAIIAARADNMSRFYVMLLFLASILTLGGFWWGAAEQQYFQKYVTGGDSYAYLTFQDLRDGHYHWKINHKGKYPVYDVIFSIQDLGKKQEVDLRDPMQRIDAVRDIDTIAVVTKDIRGYIPNFYKLKDSPKVFIIYIDARNRSIDQFVEVRKVGDEWKSAYMIFNKITLDAKPIAKHIDKGFPLNNQGKVDWHLMIDGERYKEID